MSAAIPVILMRYLALIFECVVKPSLRTRAHEVELRMGLDTQFWLEKNSKYLGHQTGNIQQSAIEECEIQEHN